MVLPRRSVPVLPARDVDVPALIADRYECNELLGRGGMASVFAATDRGAKRRVALKVLLTQDDPRRQQRHLELFEREYHILAQLVHPRIVRAFDFGTAVGTAYYAMELLSGGDLKGCAPLPWRQACSVARDVCSALALLHSRRIVHRDISPRNVRCLQDGAAKLIDFGAMTHMGPIKQLVGTPSCCAPESVALQCVDGRTDLFGLGATLYYVLTGRHAYPARSFTLLFECWRAGFSPPSEVVPDIPPELDLLVFELLRLDPDERPASAAEVMERLSAIDGQDAAEELRVAHAYLATPELVGRDAPLERVRRRLRRPADRSRSLLIRCQSGVGGTRFVDACVLDATLAGQTVLRADSEDADGGDYGVAVALARQLLYQLPELARKTAAPWCEQLGLLIPELAGEPRAGPARHFERGPMQRALHAWWTELSKQRPFVIVVDDFHRIDEPSASLIALLEPDANPGLCLLLAVDDRATWTAEAARKLLQPVTALTLEPLGPENTRTLLESIFGAVPHLELVAHRLHELCAGRPRDLLRLARHLVDTGVVRYADGTWTLPREFTAVELPASLADALRARVAGLPDDALRIAQVLALCHDQRFARDELGRLAGLTDPARRSAAVESLFAAELATSAGEAEIRLGQAAWVAAIRSTLTRAQELELERQLAQALERQSDAEFASVQHWLRAEQPERAVDLLVAHAERSQATIVADADSFMSYLLSLPHDWLETFRECLRQCDTLQRPVRDKYVLQSRMLAIMGLLNDYDPELMTQVFAHLCRDSGYDDWRSLSAAMQTNDTTEPYAPKQRLLTALGQARARYEALPERDRVLDVQTAIRDLSRAVVAATGAAAFALDVPSLRRLPRLSVFAELSPALEVAAKLVEGVDARYSGRIPHARRVYAQVLERVCQPDRAGLDESHAAYVMLGVCNALGLIEASLGMRSCLQWAERIGVQSAHEVNAALIRMIDCLYQGDVANAERHKREADRMRIENAARQLYEGGHLIAELNAHALCGDLTRVRQTREEIAPLARRFGPWVHVLRYATAEHSRMVRDHKRACAELDVVLSAVHAGSHPIWPYAAAAHASVQIELADAGRAMTLAYAYVAEAQRELGYVPDQLELSAALARAYAGEHGAGVCVDEQIARLQAAGIGGLYLGHAHEIRARIALFSGEMPTFGRHAELCGQYFLAHKNAALIARHRRLLQEGRRRIGAASSAHTGTTPDSASGYEGTRIVLALAGCEDGDQRARFALTLLTRQSGALSGALFLLREDEPECVATVGDVSAPAALQRHVKEYLTQALAADDVTSTNTASESIEAHRSFDAAGRSWSCILLCHNAGFHMAVTGVAVLGVDPKARFIPPVQTATTISRFYADKGSTSLLLAPE